MPEITLTRRFTVRGCLGINIQHDKKVEAFLQSSYIFFMFQMCTNSHESLQNTIVGKKLLRCILEVVYVRTRGHCNSPQTWHLGVGSSEISFTPVTFTAFRKIFTPVLDPQNLIFFCHVDGTKLFPSKGLAIQVWLDHSFEPLRKQSMTFTLMAVHTHKD